MHDLEKDADRRRALSDDLVVLDWSMVKVGLRISVNTGWVRTSWEAEVRSLPVDDEVAVILRRAVKREFEHFALLEKIQVHVWNSMNGSRLIRVGRLPELVRREWEYER